MSADVTDWKSFWKNSTEIAVQIAKNKRMQIYLEALKDKITETERTRKEVKKWGYFESEHRPEFLEKVRNIDPVLAEALKDLTTKDTILATITNRIQELRETIAKTEKTIENTLAKETTTSRKANLLVQKYLEILDKMSEIYKKQVQNIKIIEKYEDDVMEAARAGTIANNLKYFEDEAHKSVALAKETKQTHENAVALLREITPLRTEAEKIENEFRQETETLNGIQIIFKKVLQYFKPQKKEEIRGLQPAWQK